MKSSDLKAQQEEKLRLEEYAQAVLLDAIAVCRVKAKTELYRPGANACIARLQELYNAKAAEIVRLKSGASDFKAVQTALEKTNGDVDAAIDLLRKTGLA